MDYKMDIKKIKDRAGELAGRAREIARENDPDTLKKKFAEIITVKFVSIDRINFKSRRFEIDYDFDTDFLVYFPFIGWMYAFAFKKSNKFAMHHGRQAFLLSLAFTALPIGLTLLTVFIPYTMRVTRLMVAILVYMSHFFYFGVCVRGMLFIKNREMGEFPVVRDYLKLIEV